MSDASSGDRLDGDIALFGCGNMAGALLAGWLAAGHSPDRFTIVDPSPRERPTGVRQVESAKAAGRTFPILLLGIKPQLLGELAEDAASLIESGGLCLSLLAGIECATLARLFPEARPARVMPNLAARIGKSPVGLYSETLSASDRAGLTRLFVDLGAPEWLDSESEMALVTALVGSGPAYLYRFIDALGTAAARTGLEPDRARRLALATVEGAALLAANSGEDPGALAEKVASKGGSTRAGLDMLDADEALVRLLERTLVAARDRNFELAKSAG